MDNKEAIEYLKWIRPVRPYSLDKIKVQEAIDLAIKTLEERPQGKWENDDFTVGYTCSVCGSYRVSAKVDNFKFCPDCGAEMRL